MRCAADLLTSSSISVEAMPIGGLSCGLIGPWTVRPTDGWANVPCSQMRYHWFRQLKSVLSVSSSMAWVSHVPGVGRSAPFGSAHWPLSRPSTLMKGVADLRLTMAAAVCTLYDA